MGSHYVYGLAVHDNGNFYVTQGGDYVRIIDPKTYKTILEQLYR